jgi:DNA-binding response OmpR family regulator
MVDATILLIEDDKNLLTLVRACLRGDRYQLLWAPDGVEGLRLLKAGRPDLVLLDLMLPRMDGWETCQRIRECSDVPIIMLTALADEQSIVRGLELGADAYITKPFRPAEFRARVRAALRRCRYSLSVESSIRIDDRLSVSQARKCLVVNGQHVELTPVEYNLLRCFLNNAGRILTHQNLLTQVWGWEYTGQTEYLKVYICQLRKKIEENPHDPRYILTERGLGYRFEPPIG